LRPLAMGMDASLQLSDDAAILPPSGTGMEVSTDTINEVIHFIGHDSPAQLAIKLLAVNLSDMAAMNAQPMAYTLNLSLPPTTNDAWMQDFAHGLAQMQQIYNIHLIGGDTTSIKQGISLSATL